MSVGILSVGIGISAGTLIGIFSAYTGGKIDLAIQRVVDALMAFPAIIMALALMAALGASQTNVIVALVIILLPGAVRVVRSQVLSIKEREFVEAAVALGYSKARILFRHVVPNVLGPTIVYSTLTVPGFIMYEAILSFLGLGVESPNSSWGVLIKEGANFLETEIQLLLLPGLFFSLTLFSLNFLGDGLRDALDVKASKD